MQKKSAQTVFNQQRSNKQILRLKIIITNYSTYFSCKRIFMIFGIKVIFNPKVSYTIFAATNHIGIRILSSKHLQCKTAAKFLLYRTLDLDWWVSFPGATNNERSSAKNDDRSHNGKGQA